MAHGRDRQTDRPRYMCSNRPHLYYTCVYDISVANPSYTKWTQRSATDHKLCRCAAENESTLAQSFTMDEFGAGTLSLCRVSDGAAHEY